MVMKPTTTLCYMFLFVFFGLVRAQRLVMAFLSLWSSKQLNKNITVIFSVIIIYVKKNRGCTYRKGGTNITCSTVVFIFDELERSIFIPISPYRWVDFCHFTLKTDSSSYGWVSSADNWGIGIKLGFHNQSHQTYCLGYKFGKRNPEITSWFQL